MGDACVYLLQFVTILDTLQFALVEIGQTFEEKIVIIKTTTH